MDAELVVYDAAWRTTAREQRNEVCQQMADEYVAAHPEMRAKYGGLNTPQLVALVDIARAQGDEEERIRLDIWINAAFEYQSIGGSLAVGGTHRDLPEINVDGDRRKR